MEANNQKGIYSVAVRRDFIAQHYLIGGDWGAENECHSHHYVLEAQLEGHDLDQHGYLTDIVAVEAAIGALIGRYRDKTLNDLPEFEGLNPSLERFSRILCQVLAAHLAAHNIERITVRLWENEDAWASYSIPA